MSRAGARQTTGATHRRPQRVFFTDPLIPHPDERLLSLEMPRPSPLDPPQVNTDEAFEYDKLIALLCASMNKTTSRVMRPADIDGERALYVVTTIFALPSVRSALAVASLTSPDLAEAVSDIERAVMQDQQLDPTDRARHVKSAQFIVFSWRRLPCRNAQVAQYNDVISMLLGCNNNPVLLGADVAAKAAMFYLVKYITKDSTELNVALSVLMDAKRHVDKWRSTAEDAETNPNRASMHLAQAVSNANGAMEMACTQGAGCVLGHKAHLCSETFVRTGMDSLASLGSALASRKRPVDGTTNEVLGEPAISN